MSEGAGRRRSELSSAISGGSYWRLDYAYCVQEYAFPQSLHLHRFERNIALLMQQEVIVDARKLEIVFLFISSGEAGKAN